ncbi:MAG: beta-galactosidase [Clostridia bacterium]|nr:beta-galactosidase [Clostridia bacterium]
MIPHITGFLHGGDYNPDQWLDRPDILEKDIELMHAAHVNCVSIGIFSWALLEPEEGKYDFAWLDTVIERLHKGGIYVILATPSGARPAWMAQHHQEVLRVNPHHQRMHFGHRHNHCLTSPYYREKVRQIDTALAKRYAAHPAVIMWHISNEFSGECHCPLCQQAFRGWLKEKYGTLENLNQKWWTNFWSHRYTDWQQIEAPSPMTDTSNLSMRVDWQRFCTHQCKTFIDNEREAVQSVSPQLPCTANLMERFWDYDYFSLAESMDVVSWDSYPEWHNQDNIAEAAEFAMNHDIMRSLKKQPFLLMESTPSQVNWKPHNKLKRPGMHLLSSLQAVAHGSDSVQYFQWRKGRGGSEMFHGAVVGHDGTGDTRVFRDVTQVGLALEKLTEKVHQQPVKPEVCIIFDWENRWAIDFAQTGQRGNMRYFDTVNMHYRALWEQGIAVDFCDMRECTELSGYKLVIAPMLFMMRNGFEEKLRAYVENGGALLMTYFSGMVDEFNLAYLGETPHKLTDVLGIKATDLDALYPGQENALALGDKRYAITELCELVQKKGAETLGTYECDFYAGEACMTHHVYGKGQSWYLAAKVAQEGLNDIYGNLAAQLNLGKALNMALSSGVIATRRGECIFVQNYADQEQKIRLDGRYVNLLTDTEMTGEQCIAPFGVWVLVQK